MKRYISASVRNIGNEPVATKISEARNPNTSLRDLQILVDDGEHKVRLGVASNPNTPVELLKQLADDKSEWVRKALIDNPNTPSYILSMLSHDFSVTVRCKLAMSDHCPVDILQQMAKDSDPDVLACVASNPNTPKELRDQLKANLDYYTYLEFSCDSDDNIGPTRDDICMIKQKITNNGAVTQHDLRFVDVRSVDDPDLPSDFYVTAKFHILDDLEVEELLKVITSIIEEVGYNVYSDDVNNLEF